MNHPILIENQKKRRDIPLWMLVCFSMFSFWQMAFIYYFLEPSSAMDGKIPLPINIDYGTLLTAACYILGILTMIFLPRIITWRRGSPRALRFFRLSLSSYLCRRMLCALTFTCRSSAAA